MKEMDTQKFWQELGQLADCNLFLLQSKILHRRSFTLVLLCTLQLETMTRRCKSVNLVQCCAACQQLGHAFLLLAIRAHSPRCLVTDRTSGSFCTWGLFSLCDLEKSLEACLLRTCNFHCRCQKSGHHLIFFIRDSCHWLHHALVLDHLARHWGVSVKAARTLPM